MDTEPLLLRALKRRSVPRPPVWLMRQAGRYMAEYRAMKEKHSFLELCQSPELALEITLQPLRAFRVDAAIVFSDIMLPAEALGFHIDFAPGPTVRNAVKSADDIRALKRDLSSNAFQPICSTLRALRPVLESMAPSGAERLALLGFSGAPWTLACYLMDQGPFKHFHGTQVFAHSDPEAFDLFIGSLTDLLVDYVQAQVESGADVVQLFDTWGGNLSLADYRRFALPSIVRIVQAIQSAGALATVYVNGSSHLLKALAESGADCISIDWRTTAMDVARALPPEMAVQGNFDPAMLFEGSESIATATKSMLREFAGRPGYVANLGHGVLQRTPPENVAAFVNTVVDSDEAE
jgi:uroporphyrinogen decarboxylase